MIYLVTSYRGIIMFKHISISDSKALLDEGKAQFIDIRDPNSFAAGHIPTSLHLNDETAETFITTADKTKPTLVCCYHGNSSQSAAEFLSEKGFEDVYSIDGGFEAWKLEFESATTE